MGLIQHSLPDTLGNGAFQGQTARSLGGRQVTLGATLGGTHSTREVDLMSLFLCSVPATGPLSDFIATSIAD